MLRLDQLNEPQRQAVQHNEGPLLILAGAGTGVYPNNILAVTFTNKAANEMQERLRHVAGAAAQKVTLATFHALGVRI